MKAKEIQNKSAFVVIDSNTMERISKFYSKRGLAERFIKVREGSGWWKKHELAIAEFEYKTHYKIEESV